MKYIILVSLLLLFVYPVSGHNWDVGVSEKEWVGNITMDNVTENQGTGFLEHLQNNSDHQRYYRFDKNSGSVTYNDNTSFSDGQWYGNTTANWTTGKYNSALYFDGTDDSVRISDTSIRESRTVAVWLNITSYSAFDRIIYLKNRYMLCVNTYVVVGATNGTQKNWKGNTAVSGLTGDWHHIAFVYDNTSVTIYIDGVAESMIDAGTWSMNVGVNDELWIGGRSDDGNHINTMVDDLRIWNITLTQAEIQEVMNQSHVLTGNVTTNQIDLGLGSTLLKVGNNGTFGDTIKTVDIQINTSSDNWATSSGWYTVHSNVSDGTMYAVPGGHQVRYIQSRSVMTTTNGSITNILELIRHEYSGSDLVSPTYSGDTTNTTVAGESCLFSVKYDDNLALHPNGQYIFSTNNTGTWVNESTVNFSSTPEWVNYTKTLNSTIGKTIGWRVYAFDNNSNYGNTSIFILTTTSPYAPANITSWSNDKTSNNTLSFTINTSKAVIFNITANQSIDTYNWYKDDVDQSHNYDNISLSWIGAGTKTIDINVTNQNGTSNTISWTVTVEGGTGNEIIELATSQADFESRWSGSTAVGFNVSGGKIYGKDDTAEDAYVNINTTSVFALDADIYFTSNGAATDNVFIGVQTINNSELSGLNAHLLIFSGSLLKWNYYSTGLYHSFDYASNGDVNPNNTGRFHMQLVSDGDYLSYTLTDLENDNVWVAREAAVDAKEIIIRWTPSVSWIDNITYCDYIDTSIIGYDWSWNDSNYRSHSSKIGSDDIYVRMPAGYSTDTNLSMFFHSNTQEESQLITDANFKATTAKLSKNGYSIIASDYGGSLWGNEVAQTAVMAAYDYMVANFSVETGNIHAWGRSLGGITFLNWAMDSTNASLVRRAAFVSPVTNLTETHSSASFQGAINTAYSTDNANFEADTIGYHPEDAIANFTDYWMKMWYGTSDTTIPPAENCIDFATKVNNSGGNITLVSTGNGHIFEMDADAVLVFFNLAEVVGSVDITYRELNYSNLTANVLIDISNKTSGLQTINIPHIGNLSSEYCLCYPNGTAVQACVTCTVEGDTIWFNGSADRLPELDGYYINETESVATSTIIIPANSYGMINNWTVATNFTNIATNKSNDVCYTYYNVTTGEWDSYYVGYSWNSNYVIPIEASVLMFVDANTTITATIVTPANTNLYTGWNMLFIEGTDNETIASIIADIGTNCTDAWWFNSTAGAYSNTSTDTVQPCQGFLGYITQDFTWTRSDL